MLADIKYYLNVKRAECMQNLNNALRIAEEIIPDSEPGTSDRLAEFCTLTKAKDSSKIRVLSISGLLCTTTARRNADEAC